MPEQSAFLKISLTLVCLLISTIIIALYYSKKISIIQAIILGFAFAAYNIPFVGDSINTFFVVTFFLSVEEIFFSFRKKARINYLFLILLLLPLLSIGCTYIFYFLTNNPYQYFFNNKISFFLTPVYFYFKFYLPIFLIGQKLYRYFKLNPIESFYPILEKVLIFSFFIAILQLLGDFLISNKELKEIFLGLKLRYQANEISYTRVQAFFIEPKIFAAFIGLAIPFLIKEQKYFKATLCLIFGILTNSNTFFIFILSAIICFWALKKIKRIRTVVLTSFGIIVFIFFILTGSQNYILQRADKLQGTFLYNILLQRAIERVNTEGPDALTDNSFTALLQKDLELPIYKFYSEHASFIFFGYGPFNNRFISPKYFEHMESKYQLQKAGVLTTHMNMRWFYYVAELGLISIIIYFLILTNIDFSNNFNNKYYSYLWIVFFFNEVDYIIVMFFIAAFVLQRENLKKRKEILTIL